MRQFRNHGITTRPRQREAAGSWFYEMADLGFNYRLTDIQCALGWSQLRKLPAWVERRRAIAALYDEAFARIPAVRPLAVRPRGVRTRITSTWSASTSPAFADRAQRSSPRCAGEGIGVNVHYIPVHLHPYYRRRFGTGPGNCPVAEAAYEEILTLPIFPKMTDADARRVIETLAGVLASLAA